MGARMMRVVSCIVLVAAMVGAGAPWMVATSLPGDDPGCQGGTPLPDPPVPGAAVPMVGSWAEQPSPTTQTLLDVAFADAEHGWAVGDGVVLGTSDGGATWAVQHSVGNLYSAVAALGPAHAWVLAVDLQLLETTDGGATWRERAPGGWVMNELDLAFDGDAGWVAGMDAIFVPNVWHTSDAGQHWASMGTIPPAPYVEAWLTGIAPIPGGAVGVGERWDGAGIAVRSTDDGASWCLEEFPGHRFAAVDLRGGVGFAAANGPLGAALYRTLDAGATWVPEPLVSTAALHDVATRDAAVALAVGNGLALLTTTGGGLWLPEPLPVGTRLRGVAVAPPQAGDLGVEAWAVGDGGVILHREP